MSSVDSFIQELDAVFGKDAQKKQKQQERVAKVKKSLTAPANQFSAEMAFAEHTARNFRERQDFFPSACVTEVHHQQCTNCGQVSTYIAGEYIRFQSNKLHVKILSRREARVPEDWLLPLEIKESSYTTHQCYHCLLEDQKVMQLLEVIDRLPQQLEMFP